MKKWVQVFIFAIFATALFHASILNAEGPYVTEAFGPGNICYHDCSRFVLPVQFNQPGAVGVPAVVAPPAVIDTGSIAGQALTWVITVFGGTIGAALTAWLVKMFKKAGLEVSAEASERLNQIIVNGLHSAAPAAQAALAGKGQIAVKNATMAGMVDYVKAHGADTLKTLGVDPSDPKFQEALKARAERMISDPAIPTPAALAPATEPAAQAPSGAGGRPL